MQESSDSSIDYSRVVNNIRSLCNRNENPPEPEPIRTSVKRVRNNYLNSRKISLTCQSLRNPVLDPPQVKSDRHLLDPARKSGGRLRSPLPSPIPSPVSSPTPSPSRSRFQVSRVVESSVSPITPPSSNSCSPTSFTSNSRFRVTVVEPPKVMSAPVTIINSTNKESSETTKQSVNTTVAVATAATSPAAPVRPTSKTPSPIQMQSPQNKSVTVEQQQPAKIAANKPIEQLLSSTLTVVDAPLNTSFDSPDLEVKGYMDDSCSSFSSLDSIDRGQDLNTSLSSMESYDILLGENKGASDKLNTLTQHDECTVTKTLSNSSIDSAGKAENSASSLEASTCSNDSIYGSQEFPVLKVSSNEGTLTNSPVSPNSGDITASDKDCLTTKSDEKRVRKTSWISRGDAVPATLDKLLSIFQHPGNLFFARSSNGEVIKKEAPQQTASQDSKPPSRRESPMGGLFAWTTKKENFTEDGDAKVSNSENVNKKSPLQPNVSPENTITAETVDVEAVPVKLKQDIKENISPEHTVTADSMANLQAKPLSPVEPNLLQEKVRFEVGGNDDDDDDEDDEYEQLHTVIDAQHKRIASRSKKLSVKTSRSRKDSDKRSDDDRRLDDDDDADEDDDKNESNNLFI